MFMIRVFLYRCANYPFSTRYLPYPLSDQADMYGFQCHSLGRRRIHMLEDIQEEDV